MAILSIFAFISGVVTILSPCILPVLPVILAGSVGEEKDRMKPVGIIAGFTISFTFFTLALSALVNLSGISPDILRLIAVTVLVVFGLTMILSFLKEGLFAALSFLAKINSNSSALQGTGLFGGIVIGISLGIVWTPCVGPIMASVITLASTNNITARAVIIILSFAIGASIPLLAVMLGGRGLIKKVPWLTRNTGNIQKIFGILMIITGVMILTGIDTGFETAIIKVFPAYGAGLTSIENNKVVIASLNQVRLDSQALVFKGVSPDTKSDLTLPDYGLAPDFTGSGKWFNSEPLDMKSLRGKVILVEFWTFGCINCIRTLPYISALQKAYSSKGLVIIGIHTPEFAYEKDPDNVKAAMKKLGVTWPVFQDNDYKNWNNYGNVYWPAQYFIDPRGHVRYFHFGEGDYDINEKVIRDLLKAANI